MANALEVANAHLALKALQNIIFRGQAGQGFDVCKGVFNRITSELCGGIRRLNTVPGGARCMANSFQTVADASFQYTVLIAEDEPLIRMAYAEFLSDCGFFPIAVHNGDAAVELLQKRVAIDIVLSDIRMPGTRDGFEVARWLIQNRPNIPVILITGNSGRRATPPDLAGVPILRKPVDMEVIVQKIREAIEMHWERAG